jgi:hypothetical protein
VHPIRTRWIRGFAASCIFLFGSSLSSAQWNLSGHLCSEEIAFKKSLQEGTRADKTLTSPKGLVLKAATGKNNLSPFEFISVGEYHRLVREVYTQALIGLEGDYWKVYFEGQSEPLVVEAPSAEVSPYFWNIFKPPLPNRRESFQAVEETFIREVLPSLVSVEMAQIKEEGEKREPSELSGEVVNRMFTYLGLLSARGLIFHFKSTLFSPEEKDVELFISMIQGRPRLNLQLRVGRIKEAVVWLQKLDKVLTGRSGANVRRLSMGVLKNTRRFELPHSYLTADLVRIGDPRFQPFRGAKLLTLPEPQGELGLVISTPAARLTSATRLEIRDPHILQAWKRLFEVLLFRGTFERLQSL